VKTAKQQVSQQYKEGERNKVLVVEFARLLQKGCYNLIQLRRLAKYLSVPLSSTVDGKQSFNSGEKLAADIKAKWDATTDLGDRINVPAPTVPKGAHAKGRSAP
jgi:hypothetical protein